MDNLLLAQGFKLVDTVEGFIKIDDAFTFAAEAQQLSCYDRNTDRIRLRPDYEGGYVVDHYIKRSSST